MASPCRLRKPPNSKQLTSFNHSFECEHWQENQQVGQALPDSRKHRGPAPKDSTLFGPDYYPALRAAVADLSWLLTRHYSEKAALKLVGDRYNLRERQRLAVQRAACSDQARQYRRAHELPLDRIKGGALMIDTYNLLILVESMMAGAYIFKGRDGCLRDLAGVHGNYRKVQETVPGIQLIGKFLARYHCKQITWIIDQPVSNSGRLKQLLADQAECEGWHWDFELARNPDPLLQSASCPVVTTDGPVLNKVSAWVNLGAYLVNEVKNKTNVIDMNAA